MKTIKNILYVLLPILIIGVGLNMFYKNKMKETIIRIGDEKEYQFFKKINELNVPKVEQADAIKINKVKISDEVRDIEPDQILIYKVSFAILFEGELPDNYVISSITEKANTIEIWITKENIYNNDLLFGSRKYVFKRINNKYIIEKRFGGQ